MRHLRLAFLVVLALAPAAHAAAPAVSSNPLVADAPIAQVKRLGDQLLLLGAFRHVSQYVGSGLGMDPSSGAVDPGFPRFDGQISDVIDDAGGGWYVGGSFLVDGARPVHHLVHVLASGALDPNFKDTSGDFNTALALAGGRLYAARWFKGGVRAFDPATGAQLPGFSLSRPQQPSELEVADERLYVGGRDGVIAVDPATGDQIQSFDCTACASGQVSALAHDGSRLYVARRGGSLFAVDLSKGARDMTFAPSPGRADADYIVDNGPLVLAVDGGRLLVGGRKLDLGGPSATLVAVDKNTGAADPSFASGFDQPVHDLVLRGDAILASGARKDTGSTPQLVTLDRATGAVRSTVDTSLDGPVDALAGTGSRVFVGGRFVSRARVKTAGVALVDARTGALDPGFAVTSPIFYYQSDVRATDKSLVFLNTTFGRYDQQSFGYGRETLRMQAISLATGRRLPGFSPAPLSFDPRGRTWRSPKPGGQSYDPVVVADGARIYVGHVLGNPNSVWPQSRISVLSAATGRTVRTFDLPLRGYLTSLAKRGRTLFAGGSFRRFRNGLPAHLATLSVDSYTGALDPGFDAHTHGPVYGLGVADNRLYLTGLFDRVYPIRQSDAAAVDLVNGFVDPRFRPRTGGFDARYLKFGSPFGLGPGLLNLPSYYFPDTINPVDPATGRRVALPFSTRALTALLPVGRRYYLGASLDLPFEWSGDGALYLAGFAS